MDPVPRERLRELLNLRGPDLEQDARRVKALLLDMCPRNRREVGVLVAAAEEGIPTRLRRSVSSPSLADDIERLGGQLEEDRGLNRDVARWSVQSWAWAMGMAPAPDDSVDTSIPTAPPPEAEAEPPPSAVPARDSRAATGAATGWGADPPRPARSAAGTSAPGGRPAQPSASRRRIGAGAVAAAAALVTVVVVAIALGSQSSGGDGGTSGGGAVLTAPPETAATVDNGGGGGGGTTGQEVDLTPARAGASSSAPDGQDAAGNPVSYDIANVVDGDPSTAWRTPGRGIRERLEFEWDRPVHLVAVGLIPGYDKVDPTDGTDRFSQNRRVTRVRYEFSDGSSANQNLEDSREFQSVPIDVDTTSVAVVILGSTNNPGRDFVAVSEVGFRGWETG